MLLLLGFPIALMLAWAFDVTPEGIKATLVVATGAPSELQTKTTPTDPTENYEYPTSFR